jgi:hemoglobin-like flavoprotein
LTDSTLADDWEQITRDPDAFARLFYAVLFDMAPHVARLFPLSMAEQRRKLMATLAHIVAGAELPERRLTALGRRHVRYGATADHYTMSHLVPGWDDHHLTEWSEAYGAVSAVMQAGAAEVEAAKVPPWQDFEVLEVAGDIELADMWLAIPDELPPGYAAEVGTPYWVAPATPHGAWVPGEVGATDQGVTSRLLCVSVPTPDDEPDSWLIAETSPGAKLRLAPMTEETASAE